MTVVGSSTDPVAAFYFAMDFIATTYLHFHGTNIEVHVAAPTFLFDETNVLICFE